MHFYAEGFIYLMLIYKLNFVLWVVLVAWVITEFMVSNTLSLIGMM